MNLQCSPNFYFVCVIINGITLKLFKNDISLRKDWKHNQFKNLCDLWVFTKLVLAGPWNVRLYTSVPRLLHWESKGRGLYIKDTPTTFKHIRARRRSDVLFIFNAREYVDLMLSLIYYWLSNVWFFSKESRKGAAFLLYMTLMWTSSKFVVSFSYL